MSVTGRPKGSKNGIRKEKPKLTKEEKQNKKMLSEREKDIEEMYEKFGINKYCEDCYKDCKQPGNVAIQYCIKMKEAK